MAASAAAVRLEGLVGDDVKRVGSNAGLTPREQAVLRQASIGQQGPRRHHLGVAVPDVPKKKVIAQIDEARSSSNNATGSKFAVGELVSHPMFGQGTVTAINADKLTIEFADQVREIVDYYVRKSK